MFRDILRIIQQQWVKEVRETTGEVPPILSSVWVAWQTINSDAFAAKIVKYWHIL